MKKFGLSAALALLIAACGGGGGGSSAPAAAPAPSTTSTAVQINEATAQAVAAHALDTAQNTSTQSAASVAAGVQIDAATADVPTNLMLADVVTLAAQATAKALPAASGVVINRTVACSGGGTIGGAGTVASSGSLTLGDNLTLTATNCVETVNSAAVTINGSLGISITAGGIPAGASTFHVGMALAATNFSATTSAGSASLNGDMSFDITKSGPTSASLIVTGNSLSASVTTASGTRSATWTNYRQGISANGSSLAGTMDGTVQITSTRLGINNASYQISTQTPVQWISGYVPTSGIVVVSGAANSRLRETFTATGVLLEIDANGDGVYEKTITTSVAALRSLL